MEAKDKITEQPSHYDHLERMSVGELLRHINDEDRLVAEAVRKVIPAVEAFVEAVEPRMKRGGRLFYVGAGTSGRLGVLDASELPPTFGLSPDIVIGIIAGGDKALRSAVEKAEDFPERGWQDLLTFSPTPMDTVLGIAASGTTPYVVGAVSEARKNGLLTGCITSNPGTPLAAASEHPIETIVGPEFVTGSSRMKSGTAQKMVLTVHAPSPFAKCSEPPSVRPWATRKATCRCCSGTRWHPSSADIPTEVEVFLHQPLHLTSAAHPLEAKGRAWQ